MLCQVRADIIWQVRRGVVGGDFGEGVTVLSLAGIEVTILLFIMTLPSLLPANVGDAS